MLRLLKGFLNPKQSVATMEPKLPSFTETKTLSLKKGNGLMLCRGSFEEVEYFFGLFSPDVQRVRRLT